MARHLFISAIFVVPGLLLVVFTCRKWRVGENTVRNFGIMAAATMLIIAFLSEAAVVTVTRCRRNPAEFCEYNDNVPAMSVLAFGFLLTSIFRSIMLYSER